LGRVRVLEREITATELLLERERYVDTPRYPDLKPRLHERDSLGEFLAARPTLDLLADLDLPLWPGGTDVTRDMQLVRLRDAPADDSTLVALSHRFRAAAADADAIFELTALDAAVGNLASALKLALEAHPAVALDEISEFMRDLAIAVREIDSLQRARTTLAYVVANGEDCLHRMDRRSRRDPAVTGLDDAVRECARLYASLVLLDDVAGVKMT
jgi:hypothetical protein